MADTLSGPGRGEAASWEEAAAALPLLSGVYIFKDEEGRVLYVGKAKNLRSRVRAYCRDSGDERYHIQFLRHRIAQLDYIVTDTEKEALILENNLIKKYRPRYNIRLRDDKTYYHLRLTLSEPFPRLILTRRPKKGGPDLLLGPFSSSAAVKETIRTIQETFPLRRCSATRFRLRERPCLNYQIGKCAGPCAGQIGEEEYGRLVTGAVRFLRGQGRELVQELKAEMTAAAEREEFEQAARLRDRIAAIEKTLERQKVDSVKPVDRDVFGYAREGDRAAIFRMGYRAGTLISSAGWTFSRVTLPDDEVLASFLSQFYSQQNEPPEEIVLPFAPADTELLAESFRESRGRPCPLRVPERGELRQLAALAESNAREKLRQEAGKGDEREKALGELQRRLRLPRRPVRIEAVDISLLSGGQAVGSVVSFFEGEPDKVAYRRYKIRTVEGTNDYDMIREVLSRHFRRVLEEGGTLPDLLLIDGGKGQLNIALAGLKDLGISALPAAAIAKDRPEGPGQGDTAGRKGDRVFIPGSKSPVSLRPGSPGLLLLQQVRDEAHRFALSYHRLLRARPGRGSVLEEIPGIGLKKARLLLRHFGGLEELAEAGVEEIAALPGISRAEAEAVKNFLGERERWGPRGEEGEEEEERACAWSADEISAPGSERDETGE